jgi:hypothetical protein
MKNQCRRLFLFFLLVLSQICLAGQTFKTGCIFLNEEDVIRGELAVQGDYSNSKSCIFRRNPNAPLQVFRPFEIYGYAFESGKYYVSSVLPESGDSVFLRFMIHGALDLFIREDAQSFPYFYLATASKPLVSLQYYERPVSSIFMDSSRVSTNYKNTLYSYTDDCPSVKGQALLMKEPNYRDLYHLIHRYQRFMRPFEPLTIYDKKTNRYPFMEFGYGWSAPEHFSFNFFLPAPLLPDFLYLGLGYDTYYGIPLQLRLQHLIGFLEPELGVGIDWFPDMLLIDYYYQWSAGLNVNLGRFSIGCHYSYHFYKWFPLEDRKDLRMTLSYKFH